LPPDPEELLRQAETLAGNPTATQVDLRRAISAAYYALFHFSLAAAADMVLGPNAQSSDGYSLVYRSVDHSRLRALCTQLSGSKTPAVPFSPTGGFGAIADFARLAASLYEQRNLADYDPSRSYTVNETKILISESRQAIAWFQSGSPEQQKAFLTLLLFKSR